MSSAHIFYIPILLFVGLFIGYFIGRKAMEEEIKGRHRKRQQRQALKSLQNTPNTPTASSTTEG